MTARFDAAQLTPRIPGPTPGSPDWHYMQADLLIEDVREQLSQRLSQMGPFDKLRLANVHALLAQLPPRPAAAAAPEPEIDPTSIAAHYIDELRGALTAIKRIAETGAQNSARICKADPILSILEELGI
jgi:hypothetical protein